MIDYDDISLWEKLWVNLFTPIDLLKNLSFLRRESWSMIWNNKIIEYMELLEKLDVRGLDESMLEFYMSYPCGRLQVKSALRRFDDTPEGYYSTLAKKYRLTFSEYLDYKRRM